MPVHSKHPDYIKRLPDWNQILDCLAGERAIKAIPLAYLPKPNPSDTSPENNDRYTNYVQRAVFHNVTGRTVDNLVGQCFAVDPVATLPPKMEFITSDIDGGGMTATEQSKKALREIVSLSRCGLWVDYPEASGVVSVSDAEEGGIRPRIQLYNAKDIINWRYYQHGAISKLSLIVLETTYTKKDDGFEAEIGTQYIVLKLDEDKRYVVEIHRQNDSGQWEIWKSAMPTRGTDGMPWDEIPFQFIGASTNSFDIEKPLMLDISFLNIAHYRNSADYEEMAYISGQPTAWFSGVDADWQKEVWKGSVNMGSRGGICIPTGEQAGLLQPQATSIPKEAMDQKETQMIQLGARLVEKREVRQTATENSNNEASATSILAGCCNNVSAGYANALRWCAEYANIAVADPEKEILFELNIEFAVNRMTPEEAGAVLNLFNGRIITWTEARDKVKQGGLAYQEDDKAKAEIESTEEAELEKAMKEAKGNTDEQIRLKKAEQQQKPEPANN